MEPNVGVWRVNQYITRTTTPEKQLDSAIYVATVGIQGINDRNNVFGLNQAPQGYDNELLYLFVSCSCYLINSHFACFSSYPSFMISNSSTWLSNMEHVDLSIEMVWNETSNIDCLDNLREDLLLTLSTPQDDIVIH